MGVHGLKCKEPFDEFHKYRIYVDIEWISYFWVYELNILLYETKVIGLDGYDVDRALW